MHWACRVPVLVEQGANERPNARLRGHPCAPIRAPPGTRRPRHPSGCFHPRAGHVPAPDPRSRMTPTGVTLSTAMCRALHPWGPQRPRHRPTRLQAPPGAWTPPQIVPSRPCHTWKTGRPEGPPAERKPAPPGAGRRAGRPPRPPRRVTAVLETGRARGEPATPQSCPDTPFTNVP